MKKATLALLFATFMLAPAAVFAETLEIPLYKLAPLRKAHLRCITSEYGISVPSPERWKINSAMLRFSYVNSSSLLKDISQLIVKFNDDPVAQRRLDPDNPEGKMEVSIPASLFEVGYNTLSFQATQHFTRSCETPCAPDLWTTVNLEDAILTIDYSLKPVPLQLSLAPGFLFDPRILPNGNVNLVTDMYSSPILTNTAIAASGVAKRFDYRKTLFSTSNDIKQGVDNILIGDKAFVEEFLRRKGYEGVDIKGPFIKVIHLPPSAEAVDELDDKSEIKTLYDAHHALVIVSGANSDHIKLAAETLASLTFPYPGTDEMTVLEFQLPDITLYGGKSMLSADKILRLKSLDFHTHTFKGFQANPLELSFRLPPDFFIKENQYVKLILNFTYGAGLRPDSVLNILLNGVHVRSINLDKGTGDFLEGYRVEIPTYLFKPGGNALRFVPILTPVAKECDLVQPESLFLTIFENSSVYFPPMSHFVEMPNIALFTLNGFPFTRWPDGFESIIYVAKPEPALVDAALNVVGMMTQKNGYPLIGLKMTLEEPAQWDGEILAFGAGDMLSPSMLKNSPLSLAKESLITYPVLKSWGDSVMYARSKQISGLGPNNAVLMEYQSAVKPGRTVLVFTGETPKEIYDASVALLDPTVQSTVGGDMSLIQLTPPEYSVDVQNVGEKYYTGKFGKFSLLDFLYSSAYIYYGVLAGSIIILAIAVRIFLKRQSRARGFGDVGKKGIVAGILSILKKLFIKTSPPKSDAGKDD